MTERNRRFTDEVGNEVKIGDTWVATARHSGRGVHEWMFQAKGTVVALRQTRVLVHYLDYLGEWAVGPEVGRVTRAVDNRPLRKWADVHAERA